MVHELIGVRTPIRLIGCVFFALLPVQHKQCFTYRQEFKVKVAPYQYIYGAPKIIAYLFNSEHMIGSLKLFLSFEKYAI